MSAATTGFAAAFAGIVDLLCRAVAVRGPRGVLTGPLIVLLWARFRRNARHLDALLRAAADRTLRPARRDTRRNRPSRPRALRSPAQFAWLLASGPEAAAAAARLRARIADPEFAPLAGADPRIGRILRPLCHALGIAAPPSLRLSPHRPRPQPCTPAAPPATNSVPPAPPGPNRAPRVPPGTNGPLSAPPGTPNVPPAPPGSNSVPLAPPGIPNVPAALPGTNSIPRPRPAAPPLALHARYVFAPGGRPPPVATRWLGPRAVPRAAPRAPPVPLTA